MDALDIKTIFSQDRRHVVPLFQRPYVWNREDQWEPLWDDIRSVAERLLTEKTSRTHFLGAIVLEHMTMPYGKVETRLVVDGQQRLTTMQLFLEAFSDCCAALHLHRWHKALVKLTRNDDPMSDDPDEVFKVWPTNVDREPFRRVMDATSPAELRIAFGRKPEVPIGNPIGDGYVFFFERIEEWLTVDPTHRADALLEAMQRHMRMVVIDLDQEDDAQLIFETLNARGTPLLPSDLIKNFLFHRAQLKKVPIDQLYRAFWQHFDDDGPYWREEFGRGHARRARIDLFMQNYLSAITQDDVPVGHLYVAFRRYAESADPHQILESLKRYAVLYRRLEGSGESAREGLFLERLRAMDMVSFQPFLLELYARYSDQPDEMYAIFDDLESFIVRRVVCQLSARSYGRFVVDLLKELVKEEGRPSERIRAFLLRSTSEAARWPDDTLFESAWLDIPIFRLLVRKRTRMLLEAIELKLRSEKTEKIDWGEKLTIEHLMPQGWRHHWPLPEGIDPTEGAVRREQLINTMGNLTLLNDKLNPALSNSAWSDKLEAMKPHTVLLLNTQLSSHSAWDEAGIEARGKALFELARKIWPRPAVEAVTE